MNTLNFGGSKSLQMLEQDYASVGANSLDVFISSLDEKLEVGVAPQLSKFFTFKKSLRPKNLDKFR